MQNDGGAETIRVKFGIRDDSNREIGCVVRIWEVPHPSWNPLHSRWKLEPAATRDGEPYGGTPFGSFGCFTTLEAAPRVVAILRLSALAGLRRHAGVWSRCEPGGDFVLTGLAICAARPAFLEAGGEATSGRTEFCAVRLERSRYHSPHAPSTRVEWWT